MSTGISKEKWADMPEPKGFSPCPRGTGLDFEITETREGNTDKGKRGPHDYVQIVCTHTDDEGETYDIWEYFALTDDGLPYMKKFLARIGRCDSMVEDFEWEELVGTTFSCDVQHQKDRQTGELRAKLNYDSLVNKSHDIMEIGAPEAAKTGSKAGPQRPARGRTGR